MSDLSSAAGVNALALAIQTAEGWYPGSRSYRDNNPGNLRYAGQYQSIGADDAGFAIFPNYDAGFQALIAQIQLDAQRNPNWTLADFVANYAPPSENNDQSYLQNILSTMNANGYQANSETSLGDLS